MRSLVPALLLPLVALLGACGGADDSSGSPLRPLDTPVPEAPTTSDPPGAPDSPNSPGPGDRRGSEPTACPEVRAGIAEFNGGDFEATVEHFELAVPLAESAAEDEPSQAADDLLEAVLYYADLAPDDYPESSITSSEFARYKDITLSQCASGDPPSTKEGDDGVLA